MAIIKKLVVSQKMRAIIVSMDTPYDALMADLKDNGIKSSSVFVIDCTGRKSPIGENGYALSGLDSLTELSIEITKKLNTDVYDFLLVDSPSAIATYNEFAVAQRFITYLVNKVRSLEFRIIFLSSEDVSKPIVAHIKQLCDISINV